MTQAKVKKLQRLFNQLTPEEQAEFGKEAFPNLFAAGATHMAQSRVPHDQVQQVANDLALLLAWIGGIAVGMADAGAIQPQTGNLVDIINQKLERVAKRAKIDGEIGPLTQAVKMFRDGLKKHFEGDRRYLTQLGRESFLSFLTHINGQLR